MAVLVRTTPASTPKSNSAQPAKPQTAKPPVPTAHKVVTTTTSTAAKPIVQQTTTAKPSPKPAVITKPPVQARPTQETAAQAQAQTQSQEVQPGEVVESKPRKPRVGMDENEIKAAIEGVLEPREIKGSSDQSALIETDEHGRAKGRPIGISTGLPILGAWCYVFQENEKNPAGEKFTDEQITLWMQEEFPGRNTPAFLRPAGCRDDYNRGKFTKNIKPKVESQRYADAAGTIFVKPPRANPFQKKGEPTVGGPLPEGTSTEDSPETSGFEAQVEEQQTEQVESQVEEQQTEQQEVQPEPVAVVAKPKPVSKPKQLKK